MKFVYDVSKKPLIINHENRMLETYSKIISSYSSLLKQYNCSFEVGLFWIDFSTKKSSYCRLPFHNGYECYVFCEGQRDGKEVRIESNDGEVEYYSLSATWIVSSIERNFLKTKVSLYSDTDDIEEDMRELFWLLSNGNII